MPFANEHAARVRDPNDFLADTFRRKTLAEGVALIAGKLKSDGKNGPMTAQSYRFAKDKFTPAEARAWCKDHGIKILLFEEAAEAEAQMQALLAAAAPLEGGGYRSRVTAAIGPLDGLLAAADGEVAEPVDDGMIHRRFRLQSADVDQCEMYGRWFRVPEAVMRDCAPLWTARPDARGLQAPVPVLARPHDERSIPTGRVESAEWVEPDGFLPGGIEGVLAIDPKLNAEAARAVETGLIRAVSSAMEVDWHPSHPGLEFSDFACKMGEVIDGQRVVLEVSAIRSVIEVSLCQHGADPYSTSLEASAVAGPAPVIINTAGQPPAPVPQEETMSFAEIRAALKLPDTTPEPAVLAAVQALYLNRDEWKLRAETAEASLSAKNQAEQKREADELITAAIGPKRQVRPADKGKLEELYAKHGLEVLRSSLAVIPEGSSGVPTLPQTPPGPPASPPPGNANQAVVSTMAAVYGIDPAKVAEHEAARLRRLGR